MGYIVEVNTLEVVDTLDEARELAGALRHNLSEKAHNGVRIRQGMKNIPVTVPAINRAKITFGRQEAQATVMGINKRYTDEASAFEGFTVLPELMILDVHTRTWGVDYKGLVEVVRGDGKGTAVAFRLEAFQKAVKDQLTAEALRGISFKA